MVATRIAPLRLPFDGLAARLALIDEAGTCLDLQYYQWEQDNVGYLLLDHVLAAADRGVAVRLLVDDLSTRTRTRGAASLCLHPHLEVRLFNPWTHRSNAVTEAVQFVRQFSRLDRRMHNKLMISDGKRAIVGGRNIADAHFGLDENYNLVDWDLHLTGAGVSDLENVFEDYWNSPPATVALTLDDAVTGSDLEATRALVNEQVASRAASLPADLTTDTAWRDRLASNSLPVAHDELHITSDIPGPTSETRPTQVTRALQEAVRSATRDLVVVSPFFVPSEMDIRRYGEMVDRGVRIRLLTNSLASNSGTVSNSGLDRRRKAVLEAGVDLRELRADAADTPDWQTAPNALGYLGLHAKLYTIDGERVFIGSINLDPRSKFINTEIGMLVENAQLTRESVAGIEQLMTPANAWRVELDQNDRIIWTNDRETTHRQPARGPGQRILDRIYEILPINAYI